MPTWPVHQSDKALLKELVKQFYWLGDNTSQVAVATIEAMKKHDPGWWVEIRDLPGSAALQAEMVVEWYRKNVNSVRIASYDYRIVTADVAQDDRAARATIDRIIHTLKKMGVKFVAVDQLKWTRQGYITHLCIDTHYATKRDASASGRDFERRTNKFNLQEPARAGLKAVFGAFTGGFSADNLGPEAAPLKRIFITAATNDTAHGAAFVIDGDLSQGSLP
jgi:hypothetical protein